MIPLTHVASSAAGLVLAAAAHATGWPIVAGGAQVLSDALAAYLQTLGGRIVTGVTITRLAEMAPADVTFFDTSVRGMEGVCGEALSASFKRRLGSFRAGPGIFKMDWALSAPIPWRSTECARAATVHLGGTLEEMARSEHDAFYGRRNDNPFVLLVQPSLFDPARAPEGKHTAWAYCHVPAGSADDMSDVIEAQVERFAPGFRDCVLARRASGAAELGAWNANLAGGDVSGGAMTLGQLVARPTLRGYRTSNAAIYLCSSSTPPGGGVHGMCGQQAALAALRDHR